MKSIKQELFELLVPNQTHRL